ncbi:fluoride efflux transporter CrcB [Gemelliphila palaticanis]|uniref:Fluoride-specific ion channel FluC n=1 Tax=Gemelliphila palaticanis TaxID=81950 RepID=A0ABX2SXT8_9BACL|nr:fluoride efflux transporter CrcB [Gemella palaticanis]MBF0715160.1 fluoride efflux transporter CrcB [Gemella palaticanis]NYS47090.1 fluoride efflux transporter CrcB [Gemella palaticanis]
MNFLIVALGGAVGSIFRYSISLIPIKTTFPFLTLITNILGAVLIGFIVGVSSKKGLSSNVNLFLKTGVCGGFTTFSTFSLEAYNLLEEKNYAFGTIYIIMSFVLCLIGIVIGKKLADLIF